MKLIYLEKVRTSKMYIYNKKIKKQVYSKN